MGVLADPVPPQKAQKPPDSSGSRYSGRYSSDEAKSPTSAGQRLLDSGTRHAWGWKGSCDGWNWQVLISRGACRAMAGRGRIKDREAVGATPEAAATLLCELLGLKPGGAP